MRTVYEREYLLSMKETDLFKELEEVLEGKEYFVVTSNDDGLLYHTDLKKDHVTDTMWKRRFLPSAVHHVMSSSILRTRT